jgi:hypothetical protein
VMFGGEMFGVWTSWKGDGHSKGATKYMIEPCPKDLGTRVFDTRSLNTASGSRRNLSRTNALAAERFRPT